MNKRLMWLPAVALGVALAGQGALYYREQPVLTMTASWKHRPASVDEARDLATAVVQAEVVSVKPDADLVVKATGEPTGEDRIPTQRIQMRVSKTHKGGLLPGQTLEVFQVGGKLLPTGQPDGKNNARIIDAKQLVLEGDPPYKVGEQYVMMLEDGPRGTLRPIAPEGRYRVERGVVSAMVDNDATKLVQGKALADFERTLEVKPTIEVRPTLELKP